MITPSVGEAERADIGGHVRHPQRHGQVAECVEDLHAVVPRPDQPFLLRREARQDDVGELAFFANGGDDGVARGGQHAGAFRDFAQDGVEVEAGADAKARHAERRDTLAQRLDLTIEVVNRRSPVGSTHGGCTRRMVGPGCVAAPELRPAGADGASGGSCVGGERGRAVYATLTFLSSLFPDILQINRQYSAVARAALAVCEHQCHGFGSE